MSIGFPVLGLLCALTILAGAATPTPIPAPTGVDPSNPLDLALWLYKKAQAGEWRMVFAGALCTVVWALRVGARSFKAELEEKSRYRDVVLPLTPLILSSATAAATDLFAGRDVGMSLYRGLNVGLMAMGGYAGYKKAVAPALSALWARLRPTPTPPPPPPPPPVTPPAAVG